MIKFTHKALRGECVVTQAFADNYLQHMCYKAELLGLIIQCNSAYRKDANVKHAIVEPSKMSNHMVGHAIDCNIIEGKKFWSSTMLANPTGKVLELIEYCKSIGMRWGGDFKKRDTVHFDDALNVKYPDVWASIYKTINNTSATA